MPAAHHARGALLTLAAAAEQNSDHPLSRAIVDAAVESGYTLPATTDFESLTARGVVVDHRSGRRRAAHRRGQPPSDRGAARSSIDADAEREVDRLGGRRAAPSSSSRSTGTLEGVIGIADEVKKNAPRAIDALHALGLRVIMMTGDNERAAAAVASAVGVREYRARRAA